MTDTGVFAALGDEYEQVVFGHDADTGLRCIIAVHSTVLGPSLGGTRFLPYATEHQALVDVLRLARGMTHKHAAAGLDLGGGKAVIIGDPATDRPEALIRSYARQVDRMGGTYLTAEDVGTTQADMDLIAEETTFVTGTSAERGGSGDPSPATALGVYWAMRAAALHRWGSEDLAERRVTVLGVGKVGRELVGHLVRAGALVTVADISAEAISAVTSAHDEISVVEADAALASEADVLAPCALGGLLDATSIPALPVQIVCGAANNQLATAEDAQRLADVGVLYVPDFVANAGGVINIAEEAGGYNRQQAYDRVQGIHDNVARVLDRAATENITTEAAAYRIVEQRLADARFAATGG